MFLREEKRNREEEERKISKNIALRGGKSAILTEKKIILHGVKPMQAKSQIVPFSL